jgi:hypothetical protein
MWWSYIPQLLLHRKAMAVWCLVVENHPNHGLFPEADRLVAPEVELVLLVLVGYQRDHQNNPDIYPPA